MKIYIKAAIADISSYDREDRQDIALDPNTPVEALVQLAFDNDPTVKLCVYMNPSTPKEVLDDLLNNGNERFLEQLAFCLETDEYTLGRLSQSEYASIRYQVARNPHTPISVLNTLSDDDIPSVRWAVAENINTPVDILVKLSNDTDATVRHCVAENMHTPTSILEDFAKMPDVTLSGLAKRTLKAKRLEGEV